MLFNYAHYLDWNPAASSGSHMHINQKETDDTFSIHVRHKPFGFLSVISLNRSLSLSDVPRVSLAVLWIGVWSGYSSPSVWIKGHSGKGSLITFWTVFLFGLNFAYASWFCSKLLNQLSTVRLEGCESNSICLPQQNPFKTLQLKWATSCLSK